MARATYATISVPREIRDELRRLAINHTTDAGRVLTLADVISAALTMAVEQPDAFRDALAALIDTETETNS